MNFKIISKRANRPSKFIAATLILLLNLTPLSFIGAQSDTINSSASVAPTTPTEPATTNPQTPAVPAATPAVPSSAPSDNSATPSVPAAPPSASNQSSESTNALGSPPSTPPAAPDNSTSPANAASATVEPGSASASTNNASNADAATPASNKTAKGVSPMTLSPSGGSGGDPHSDDQRKAISTEALFQPDPIAGSLRYSYPLTLPLGRNNLTPHLSLEYSSQPGSNVNTFGYGWSVSIPAITRINKTGTDALFGQDYYFSSIDGELASTSPGLYGPIAETGSFNKYSFSTSTNSWTVTDKTGTVYTFGSTTSSRLDNPGNSGQISQWMLDSVRDKNNNYIKFTYYKDAGEIYPNQILYTGNGTTDGPFEVDFLRTTRNDAATSSQPGFPIHSNYLINEVDVKVSGTWVRKYVLGYTTGDNQSRSLLGSITESGQDDLGGTITLPSTVFSYQSSYPGWAATAAPILSPAIESVVNYGISAVSAAVITRHDDKK